VVLNLLLLLLLLLCSRLTKSLEQYRYWLEEEKRVSADPVNHQAFLTVSPDVQLCLSHNNYSARSDVICLAYELDINGLRVTPEAFYDLKLKK
jgi:hypothetical protein